MSIKQGREPYIGVGLEATPGTAVATAKYLPFVTCTLKGVHEPLADEAAKGVREKVWGAITGKQRGEGNIEIYVDAENAPYLIYPALGTCLNTGVVGEATAYDHIFTRKTTSTPKTLSIVHNDTADQRRYTYATINTLDLTVTDGIATLSAAFISKFPTSTTTSAASYTSERILAFKDYTVQFGSGATGTAALAAANAAAVTKVRSFSLKINNNAEAQYLSGSASCQDVTVKEFEVTGEYTLFFENTTERSFYETLLKGSDPVRAMVVTFTGDTIGTTTELIKIEIPHFHLTDRSVDTAISGFLTESPSYLAQYDPTEARSIKITVRNATASY